MRLKGLLGAYRSIRSRLQAGPSQEELARLRADIRSLVQSVEAICASRGLTPDHLAAPSRRVYRFLKDLDAGHLPAIATGPTGPPPRPRPAIRNVVRIGDQIADQFWDQLPVLTASAERQQHLRKTIAQHVEAIETVCAQQHALPDDLEIPSRQAYCWLKFLTTADNFADHLEALNEAKKAIDDHAQILRHPARVHLLHLGVVWRRRQYAEGLLLKVSEGFLRADPATWKALIEVMVRGCVEHSTRRLKEFVASEDYNETLSDLESCFSSDALPTQGCVHNLNESFDRVNATFFAGGMARPRLVWNRALTGRKFGHFRPSHRYRNAVGVSRRGGRSGLGRGFRDVSRVAAPETRNRSGERSPALAHTGFSGGGTAVSPLCGSRAVPEHPGSQARMNHGL